MPETDETWIQGKNRGMDTTNIIFLLKGVKLCPLGGKLFCVANARDECQTTPLHLASQEGHLEIAEAVLEKGADPNVGEDYTRSPKPLHLASKNGHVAIVKVLLEKGAIVDAKSSSNHYTPLECACNNGHLEVVKVLLENGADAKYRCYGRSPMSLASKHPELQKVLRDYGAQDGY